MRADELAKKIICQPELQFDDEVSIKEESEDDTEEDAFETLSDNCTNNNDEDTEEDKQEIKDFVKIELDNSSDDDGSLEVSSKGKRKYVRNRPPFECPFCKVYSVPLSRAPLQIFKHLQNCKLETKQLIKEIYCFNCNQFKCLSNNIISFYHHILSCPVGGLERVPLNIRVFQCNLCPPSEKTPEHFVFSKFLPHITHHKGI